MSGLLPIPRMVDRINQHPGDYFRMPERIYGATLLWGDLAESICAVEINNGESHACVAPELCQGAARVYYGHSPIDAVYCCLVKRRGHVIFLKRAMDQNERKRFWVNIQTRARDELRGHEDYYEPLAELRARMAPAHDYSALYLEEEPECQPSR